jgi:hypothetical protein
VQGCCEGLTVGAAFGSIVPGGLPIEIESCLINTLHLLHSAQGFLTSPLHFATPHLLTPFSHPRMDAVGRYERGLLPYEKFSMDELQGFCNARCFFLKQPRCRVSLAYLQDQTWQPTPWARLPTEKPPLIAVTLSACLPFEGLSA